MCIEFADKIEDTFVNCKIIYNWCDDSSTIYLYIVEDYDNVIWLTIILKDGKVINDIVLNSFNSEEKKYLDIFYKFFEKNYLYIIYNSYIVKYLK